MGLRYDNLYKNDALSSSFKRILYKEDTNVLCYYVIKTILLFYNDDFLKWCLINNNNIIKFDKNKQNLTNFFKFIKDKYDSNLFIDSIEKMELFYRKHKGPTYNKYNNDVITTTRMSICEN